MKKCILFILSFCFIFLMSISANANIMPIWTRTESSIKTIKDSEPFNIISGCPEEQLTNTDFYNYADVNSSVVGIQKGGYYWEGKIVAEGNSDIYADVYTEFQAESSYVLSAMVKLDGNIIYQTETTGSDDPHDIVNMEIDLNEYFGTENLLFSYSADQAFNEIEGSVFTNNDLPRYDSYDMGLGCMIGTIYQKNKIYEGKDLYFITNVVSPLTEEEILDSIVVTDPTEGTISEKARIVDSNYILEDGKINVGTYQMKIVASDKAGNISVQNAYVTVADVIPPVIEASDVETEYTKKITDLKTLFTATDNSGYCELVIIENNYTANSGKKGSYTVTAKATDGIGNSTTKTITITVIDKVGPTITVSTAYATTTNPLNDKNDLMRWIKCIDYIDGSNTNVEINDNDSYFSNKGTPGTYEFSLVGTDQTGNKGYARLTLIVTDDDYPAIYADSYTITVDKGASLTEEDIANMLIQSGQIDSLDNLIITSAYFDTPDVVGDYDLIVSTPNGIFKDVISVKDNSNQNNEANIIDTIDYSIPVKKEENDLTYIYVIVAVVGLLIISSCGIIIYKRKH